MKHLNKTTAKQTGGRRRRNVPSVISGVRRRVALLLIDLTASTEHKYLCGHQLGTGKVIRFTTEITAIVRSLVRSRNYRGVIAKYLGDAILVYFDGDQAVRQAVETAIRVHSYFRDANKEIQVDLEKTIPTSAIDYGEVDFVRYPGYGPLDPHGLAVDRVFRLSNLAKPDQILITLSATRSAPPSLKPQVSESVERRMKGILQPEGVAEILWNEGRQLQISDNQSDFLTTVAADPGSVQSFIQRRRYLSTCSGMDVALYTGETLLPNIRGELIGRNTPILIRLVIRDPATDSKKKRKISGTIDDTVEIEHANRNVKFEVRFFRDEPLLKSYFFHGPDHNNCEALLGLYQYISSRSVPFVGAEGGNRLIYAKNGDGIEGHLLTMFRSRFDWLLENSRPARRRHPL